MRNIIVLKDGTMIKAGKVSAKGGKRVYYGYDPEVAKEKQPFTWWEEYCYHRWVAADKVAYITKVD